MKVLTVLLGLVQFVAPGALAMSPAQAQAAAKPGIRVDVDNDPCRTSTFIEGVHCYRGVKLLIHGSGFQGYRAENLRAYRTGMPGFDALDEVAIDIDSVDAKGTFETSYVQYHCLAVANYGDVRGLFWIKVEDRPGNLLGLWPIAVDRIACKPPFQVNNDPGCATLPCGVLTVGGPSSVSLGFIGERGQDDFRIAYGVMGKTGYRYDKLYDSTISVNNLEPGVAYWFKIQGCHVPTFGKDTCSDWFVVGYAAP